MTHQFDPLAACEARLAKRQRQLKARQGRKEYRESVPRIEAEITKLKGVRDMILAGRMASRSPEAER